MIAATNPKPELASGKKPINALGNQNFNWPLANAAEKVVRDHLAFFLKQNSFARRLAGRMREETGTDFFEWIDYLSVPEDCEPALLEAGFVRQSVSGPERASVWEHPRATLPQVLQSAQPKPTRAVLSLRPESIADFIACHHLGVEPDGEPFSRYRRAMVFEEKATRLEVVERRAYRGFDCRPLKPDELRATIKARELWRTRPRLFAEDPAGFAKAKQVLEQVLGLVDGDLACHTFFEAERKHWEGRNRAGRLQKFRQDQLGLGWGNHDHHTFRCSREHFVDVIEFLLKLGFEKRERYYAGAEAGWGAQILEQSPAGIVVFADVDLMPDETQVDFSVMRLAPAPRLGTVGLWVALHGESFLEAGLHHLEARFDFPLLREQLKSQGINTMKPFSDFEFLRQAFTEGELWPVRRQRVERLLKTGLVTREQFDKFVREGAIGSHLENLQRHGGFKGFNQKSVSVIISATDPRKQHAEHSAIAA